jgi:hypothetical protein
MFISNIETLHFENELFEGDKIELRHSIATFERFWSNNLSQVPSEKKLFEFFPLVIQYISEQLNDDLSEFF